MPRTPIARFAPLLSVLLACSSSDAGEANNATSPADSADGGGATAGNGGTSAGRNATSGSGGDSSGASGDSGGDAGDAGNTGAVDAAGLAPFSFFVTSLESMRKLSGSQSGFGGDLSYGEKGAGAGLRGADKICSEIAELSMPGASAKSWRAFLSVTAGGENGGPVHAVSRIGQGPWYDRLGRLVAENLTDLINTRPEGADTEIINDLPNEFGVPNHNPDGSGEVDNHDTLTGSDENGELYGDADSTCNDWTSSEGSGSPRVGHSWPRTGPGGGGGGGGPGGNVNSAHWISALDEAGCAPGVSLIEMGPPNQNIPTVGSGGGYGGIYCFALSP